MGDPTGTASVVIVGGGPRGAGLVERLLANAPELLVDTTLTVHVVEPFSFGTGRIWRWDQSPLLWANSQAEDMTMFTDSSSSIEGPIRRGPTFEQWARDVAPELALPDAVREEADGLHGMTFASRRLVHEYLAWFFWQSLGEVPPGVRVQLHRARAVDLSQDGERHLVHLDRGEPIPADIVLLAQGHLPTVVLAESATTAQSAREHGLVHLAEDYTADTDLSALTAGLDVVVRGAGLAFVDLAVLVGQGRGGTFLPAPELGHGALRYFPSGAEPVLHVGSRRGVPFRSKITYRLQGPPVPHLRFFDDVAVETLLLGDQELDFRRDVWPLLAKELAFAHYHELFAAHPEAVTGEWAAAHEAIARFAWGSPEFDRAIELLVPHPADRFDLDSFDRPLQGLRFETPEALQQHVIGHIEADLARRRDPRYSADLAVFNGLLAVLGPLSRIIGAGALSSEASLRDLGWFIGFFSYFASGPPPQRLREIVALARAGVVRFLGPDVQVEIRPAEGKRGSKQPAAFVASSPASPATVAATTLVEARVPRTSVSGTADDLLAALFRHGVVTEQVLVDASDTRRLPTGRLLVAPDTSQVVDAAGLTHDWLYAFGSGTSAATPGAFSRPGTDAAFFRQNDHSVRHVLTRVSTPTSEAARPRTTPAAPAAPRGEPPPVLELLEPDDPDLDTYRADLAHELMGRSPETTPRADRVDIAPDVDGPVPQVLALRSEQALVAAVSFDHEDGLARLHGLWTASSHRGRGLARRLLAELESHLARNGCSRIDAVTTVRTPETQALLRSAGYRPGARTGSAGQRFEKALEAGQERPFDPAVTARASSSQIHSGRAAPSSFTRHGPNPAGRRGSPGEDPSRHATPLTPARLGADQ